ncbi:unnamed protein product, partial [Iphiclides podalirius]
MQALTFLALVNSGLSILAQLVPNNGQYVLPPELMDSGGYIVKIMPKAPVSYANPFPLYQNPYAAISYVNPQDNFTPGVYDEYKKRERLKLFYDSLAAKLSSALLDKIAIANQANGDNIQGPLPTREVLTSKSALSKESAPILDTGRRSPNNFNTEASDTPIIIPESPLDDNTRKYLNRITYIINKIPQTSFAEQAELNDWKSLTDTQGDDMKDKVFVKDQQYLNQKDTNLNEQKDLGSIDVNTKESSNIENAKQIDLEKLNKFLLHNSIPQKSDPALFETLKDLNENLTLPYESTQVTERLLTIYKSEVTPIRKYILLKIYDYLTRNKAAQSETLWQPSFVLVLLDLKKEASTENTDVLNNDDGNYIVVEPYNYTKDIELALTKLVQNMFKAQQEKNDAIVNNDDILANYTINQISETTHEDTKSTLKDVSCQDANNKFDAILKLLENIFNLNEDDNKIDLNMQEFIKVFEILNIFRNRLSLERGGEVTSSSILILELERQLLQKNDGICHQQPNAIAQTLISRLVDVLQEVIQYLKANDYDDETIKEVVVNLVEILMPDINAIALKDCEARAQEELIGKLFSKIYSGKNVEGNKIQFVSGYELKRDSVDNIFHLLSMQQLLDDISKYKNL